MWYEDLAPDAPWTGLWSGYILCSTCRGIRRFEVNCPVCNAPLPVSNRTREVNGIVVATSGYAGAEGRYEDYVYLQMMEREWKRAVAEAPGLDFYSSGIGPSSRASVVLLFWTYFETRIERLLRAGMEDVPVRLMEDTLERYSSIGARLDRLYRILFNTTYSADLASAGHAPIWNHLLKVQKQRNHYVHGHPAAIDDALVLQVVEHLQAEHEAWISVFNKHRKDRIQETQLP